MRFFTILLTATLGAIVAADSCVPDGGLCGDSANGASCCSDSSCVVFGNWDESPGIQMCMFDYED
ncbi:hypothetical protein N7540_006946 [Penicillium herquei]|nr:hypothetical protein N7540_006946 [Penicillium herquei]